MISLRITHRNLSLEICFPDSGQVSPTFKSNLEQKLKAHFQLPPDDAIYLQSEATGMFQLEQLFIKLKSIPQGLEFRLRNVRQFRCPSMKPEATIPFSTYNFKGEFFKRLSKLGLVAGINLFDVRDANMAYSALLTNKSLKSVFSKIEHEVLVNPKLQTICRGYFFVVIYKLSDVLTVALVDIKRIDSVGKYIEDKMKQTITRSLLSERKDSLKQKVSQSKSSERIQFLKTFLQNHYATYFTEKEFQLIKKFVADNPKEVYEMLKAGRSSAATTSSLSRMLFLVIKLYESRCIRSTLSLENQIEPSMKPSFGFTLDSGGQLKAQVTNSILPEINEKQTLSDQVSESKSKTLLESSKEVNQDFSSFHRKNTFPVFQIPSKRNLKNSAIDWPRNLLEQQEPIIESRELMTDALKATRIDTKEQSLKTPKFSPVASEFATRIFKDQPLSEKPSIRNFDTIQTTDLIKFPKVSTEMSSGAPSVRNNGFSLNSDQANDLSLDSNNVDTGKKPFEVDNNFLKRPDRVIWRAKSSLEDKLLELGTSRLSEAQPSLTDKPHKTDEIHIQNNKQPSPTSKMCFASFENLADVVPDTRPNLHQNPKTSSLADLVYHKGEPNCSNQSVCYQEIAHDEKIENPSKICEQNMQLSNSENSQDSRDHDHNNLTKTNGCSKELWDINVMIPLNRAHLKRFSDTTNIKQFQKEIGKKFSQAHEHKQIIQNIFSMSNTCLKEKNKIDLSNSVVSELSFENEDNPSPSHHSSFDEDDNKKQFWALHQQVNLFNRTSINKAVDVSSLSDNLPIDKKLSSQTDTGSQTNIKKLLTRKFRDFMEEQARMRRDFQQKLMNSSFLNCCQIDRSLSPIQSRYNSPKQEPFCSPGFSPKLSEVNLGKFSSQSLSRFADSAFVLQPMPVPEFESDQKGFIEDFIDYERDFTRYFPKSSFDSYPFFSPYDNSRNRSVTNLTSDNLIRCAENDIYEFKSKWINFTQSKIDDNPVDWEFQISIARIYNLDNVVACIDSSLKAYQDRVSDFALVLSFLQSQELIKGLLSIEHLKTAFESGDKFLESAFDAFAHHRDLIRRPFSLSR